MHPSSETPQPGRARTHTRTPFFFSPPSSLRLSIPLSTPPSLTLCLYTPSSSSRQPRQVADRQTEAWQTGIITCGCLRGTWQLYLQLSPENAFSSPAESSWPRPARPPASQPASQPACLPIVHRGGARNSGVEWSEECWYGISLPQIMTINERQIQSVQSLSPRQSKGEGGNQSGWKLHVE